MIEWLTTHAKENSDYQRGWRRHAVEMTEAETKMPLQQGTAYIYADGERSRRARRAICGLQPTHGWGFDLFITEKCARCERVLRKLK